MTEGLTHNNRSHMAKNLRKPALSITTGDALQERDKLRFLDASRVFSGASLVAQRLKRLPATRETRVRSLGREDLLEKEVATHSSILAWRIPWREESGRLQSTGLQRVRHDWATSLSWETKFVFNMILTFEVYSPIEGTDIDETILQARVIVQIMGKDKVLY